MTTTLCRRPGPDARLDPRATALLVDGDVSAGSAATTRDGRRRRRPWSSSTAPWSTPAFVDAHVHATRTGLALNGLDLTGTPSLRRGAGPLAAYARERGRRRRARPRLGRVVAGPSDRPPTRAELDRAPCGGVVYLTRIDVHSRRRVVARCSPPLPGAPGCDGYDASGLLTRDAHHAARAAALDARHRRRSGTPPSGRRCAAAPRSGIGRGPRAGRPRDLLGRTTSGAPGARGRDEPGPDVVGYWGELGAVASSGPASSGPSVRPATCSPTARSARTPPTCAAPYADARRPQGAGYLERRRRSATTSSPAPEPGSRPGSTPSATPRSTPCRRVRGRGRRGRADRSGPGGTGWSTPRCPTRAPGGSPRRARPHGAACSRCSTRCGAARRACTPPAGRRPRGTA